MMSQHHLSDLPRSRTLVRDLTASMVGLLLGVVVISLALGVTTGADLPGEGPPAQLSPVQADAAVRDLIAELQASNEQLAAGLARMNGGVDRSVLPPRVIAQFRLAAPAALLADQSLSAADSEASHSALERTPDRQSPRPH